MTNGRLMLKATLTSSLLGILVTIGQEGDHLIPKTLLCGLILVLASKEQVFVSSVTDNGRINKLVFTQAAADARLTGNCTPCWSV